MDDEIVELMQKMIEEVRNARKEIEQQKQNNLQIANKLAENADILKGAESEKLKEAYDDLEILQQAIKMAMEKIVMIAEAYQSHERALITHHEKLQGMEVEMSILMEQMEQKFFSELHQTVPLILEGILREIIEKQQKNIIKKIKNIELGFDGRLKTILEAEEAIIKQKKNIYLGVSTIVAIGIIAMNFLR